VPAHVMQQGHEDDGEWNFCYAEQVRLLDRHLKPGMVVVDVGCGPSLPYEKNGAFVIGLEPSYPSIRHNEDVDIRIMGSATKMPFPSHSLDMVVCFYSIHHFVGDPNKTAHPRPTSHCNACRIASSSTVQ
jgi:SAM-dependent methyltransferase